MVLVGVSCFLVMICRVGTFDKKLKEMEAEFRSKYNMNSLKVEVRNEFQKFKSEKEKLVVEDVEVSEPPEEKKHRHKRKQKNKVEPVAKLPPVDKKPDDDHSDNDDRIVNIKNSVVYITSSPPSPTHEN